MIPKFIELGFPTPWPVLPPGVYLASMTEIQTRFVTNGQREKLFLGIAMALSDLAGAGCRQAWLGGSFVTAKPAPRYFDGCWEPQGTNVDRLDPVLLNFDDSCARQKEKYFGAFFPTAHSGPLLEFIQIDKHSGRAQGIIGVNFPMRRD